MGGPTGVYVVGERAIDGQINGENLRDVACLNLPKDWNIVFSDSDTRTDS
jgi:hypothetical protein